MNKRNSNKHPMST